MDPRDSPQWVNQIESEDEAALITQLVHLHKCLHICTTRRIREGDVSESASRGPLGDHGRRSTVPLARLAQIWMAEGLIRPQGELVVGCNHCAFPV